jgi:AcrR family transcriptional regulator
LRPAGQVRKGRRRAGGEPPSVSPERTKSDGATVSRREVIEEHLLDVAAKRFASTGYRQTTLDDIARHAGVAKASMYRYFENKQELLTKIFLKVASSFSHSIQPLLTASLPPQEKLRRVVQNLLRTIGENVALFTVFYSEESDLPPRLRAEVLLVRQRFVSDLENVLREGMEQSVFRHLDARLVVYAIMGMCAWLHKWYGPHEGHLEDVTTAFVGLVEHGCLAAPGAEDRTRLADRLRQVQDLLGILVGQAERLEQPTTAARR